MTRRLVVALATFGLLLLGAPVARAASTVVNVSDRSTSQSEAAVAASPLDPNDVVVISNVQRGYGIFVSVSHDGGTTWARTVLGDGDAFGRACCDPTITWDPFGNLYVSWLGFAAKPYPTAVPILVSTDAGDSWRRLTTIRPPQPRTRATATMLIARADGSAGRDGEEDRGPGSLDQPTILAGPHALWATWNNDGQMQIAGARIRGLGDIAPFRAVRDVPGSVHCTFGDIAIGPGGSLAHVCQKDEAGSSPRASVFRFTVDPDGLGSAPFTRSRIVARTHVSLFEAIRPQRTRTVDAEVGLAWLATGPDAGRLVMLFTDEEPDQSDNTNIVVKTSDNGGATWSPRNEVTSAVRSQFLPRIAMDAATGRLVAGWHDASLDDGSGPDDTDGTPNSDAMYALAFSVDGGATWSAPAMVSQGASSAAASYNLIEFGDYTGLGFAFGVAHPAWADNSNSTGDNPDGTLHAFDVYSSAVPEP